MKLTNGIETFAVESKEGFRATDTHGGEYRLCGAGLNCDHSQAPQNAQVWHDSENTETLWVLNEYCCLANPWGIDKQPSDIYWLYEVEAPNFSYAGGVAMRCAEIAVHMEFGLVAPTRILIEQSNTLRAQEWRDTCDTWPSAYCADIAARYGICKEAGK